MLAHSFPFAMAAVPCFERIQDFIKLRTEYETRVSLIATSSRATSTEPLIPGFEEPLFATKNGNIVVKSKDQPIIHGANISILPGTFNVVAGKVASGKSVLLQALMGQVQMSGNARLRTSNIAYCPQVPWLVTGTAKDNVIGKSARDEPWYRTVITACGLLRDFDDLPQGDSTPIGSKGVSLSGGQKQRLVRFVKCPFLVHFLTPYSPWPVVSFRESLLFLSTMFSAASIGALKGLFGNKYLAQKVYFERMASPLSLLPTHASTHTLFSYDQTLIFVPPSAPSGQP